MTNLQSLRDRIAALDPYTAQGARDCGFGVADLATEYVRAFQAHVLDMIDEALSDEPSAVEPTASVSADEHERYKRCLYRANGRLMQMGQEPEKLEYPTSTAVKSSAERIDTTRGPCAVCGTTDEHHGFGCPVG